MDVPALLPSTPCVQRRDCARTLQHIGPASTPWVSCRGAVRGVGARATQQTQNSVYEMVSDMNARQELFDERLVALEERLAAIHEQLEALPEAVARSCGALALQQPPPASSQSYPPGSMPLPEGGGPEQQPLPQAPLAAAAAPASAHAPASGRRGLAQHGPAQLVHRQPLRHGATRGSPGAAHGGALGIHGELTQPPRQPAGRPATTTVHGRRGATRAAAAGTLGLHHGRRPRRPAGPPVLRGTPLLRVRCAALADLAPVPGFSLCVTRAVLAFTF
ncbi:hypothetical protein HPB48_002722 [Haemaphysalis longicornis]|uniref:Uncharacterized protein n=1 Tax=Haemaphysalis longicornis TaxID=44386 RepID=A0A9J6GNK0_HAELO|nr:hypothetical protein HPB48_002722 [Haemaphysalis longicornis]